MLLTMVATTGTMWGQTTYTKVTTAPSDWTGTYIIVADDSNVVFTGQSGTNNYGGYASVTITNGSVTGEYADYEVEIEKNGDYYTMKHSSSEKYLGWTSGNYLYFSTSTPTANSYKWSLSTSAILNANDNTRKLQYNSGSPRFACYTSSQKVAYLYKKETGGGEDPSITAADVNIAYDATEGSIAYTLTNATGNVGATITSGDWLTLGTVTESAVPFTCSANTSNTTRTATVKLSYTGATDKVVTVTQDAAPVVYTTIPDIFNAATTTETSVNVTFNNWVVSGVSTNGKNVYITDGTNGLIIYYTSDMSATFSAGQILSGENVSCTLKLYNGAAELINVNAAEDLTITTGGTVTPADIELANLTGVNTGALLHYENLTCTYNNNKYFLTDGTTNIQLYNSLFAFTDPTVGNKYNITGVYAQYNTTKEIMPRNADDLTPYVGPTLSIPTDPINIACTGNNGSLDITYNNLTISSTENFGVTFYAADGTTPLTSGDIPTWVGQSFSGNSTDGYKFNYNIGNYTGLEDRVARLKVYGMDDDLEHEASSGLLVITQSAPVPTYDVIFNLDGGTFVPNSDFTSDAVEKEAGTYALPSATKAGTTFAGWKNDATAVVYASGANYEVTDDVSFTAQWSNSATVTYTIISTNSVATTGTAPAGSTASFINTYTNNKYQLTGGNSMTLALSGYQNQIIKSITLSMHSNNSSGAGTFSAVAGSTTLASISPSTAFNTASWYGAWSNPDFVDVTPTMTNSNYVIQSGENVTIVIAATANSLFCQSFTIEYEASTNPLVAVTPTSREVDYQAHNSASESLNFTISSSNITNPTYTRVYCDANGAVLNDNPYDWFTATILENAVSFTTTVNTGVDRTAYFKVYATVDSEPVYSGLCSVTQLHELHTYTLVKQTEQLVSGKHYIIASAAATGAAQVMGPQSGNVRSAVNVTITQPSSGVFNIEEVEGIREFVLNVNGSGNWTIYDTKHPGYLYPSDPGNNYIGTRTNNSDGDSQWGISFSSNEAIFTAQGDNTRRILRYNYNNGNTPRFSCYKTDSSVEDYVYLYVKDNDTDFEYYGTEVVYDGTSIPANETLTVGTGSVMTITNNSFTNNNPDNIIIEDGGQVIVNNAGVQATFKKSVSHSAAKDAANWYTISSPVDNVATASVTNLIQATAANYDLYYYDEASQYWFNHKAAGHAVANMTNGKGYLYWNNGGDELSFPGELNSGSVEIAVTKTGEGDLSGFNLIGNPYSHNIYKGTGTAIPNTNLSTGFYTLSNAGAWTAGTDNTTAIKPGQGILVKATAAGTVTITMTNTTANGAKRGNEFIKFIIANSQYEDVAYAMFENEEKGLNKINHRNASIPMLYIAQNEENYAIATMSEETQSFNLNFKAMTTGQYTLSYKAEGNYDYLHVIDRMTGEDVDMLLDGEYSFIASPSDNDARFIVKLGYNANNNAENDIFAYQDGSDIIVNGEGELQVFDVTGRMVMNQHVNGVQTVNVKANGVYIFKLNENVQKIVVR